MGQRYGLIYASLGRECRPLGNARITLAVGVFKSPDSGDSEAEEGDSQGDADAPRMKPGEVEVGGD